MKNFYDCYYCKKTHLAGEMVMRTVYKSTRRGTCKTCCRDYKRMHRAKKDPDNYFLCGECKKPSHRAHRGAGPEAIRLITQCKYCGSENLRGMGEKDQGPIHGQKF